MSNEERLRSEEEIERGTKSTSTATDGGPWARIGDSSLRAFWGTPAQKKRPRDFTAGAVQWRGRLLRSTDEVGFRVGGSGFVMGRNSGGRACWLRCPRILSTWSKSIQCSYNEEYEFLLFWIFFENNSGR